MPPALRTFQAQWRARAPDAWAARREQAMRLLAERGLPSQRDESWRYTNLRALLARDWPAAPDAPARGDPPAGVRWLTDDGRIASVVLVNGIPLQLPAAPGGGAIDIRRLRDVAAGDPASIEAYLGADRDSERSRWQLLNTALFEDGLLVRIRGADAPPLCIVHVTDPSGAAAAAHPRVIVEVDPGSGATVIEHFLDHGDGAALCNSVTQLTVGDGASVEHYRVFSSGPSATHLDSLDVRLQRDSRLRQYTAVLGGDLVRCGTDVRLQGAGAEFDCHALLVGHGARHVDWVTVATHAAPLTRSGQTVRSIAAGTSRVVCNSSVVVAPGAARAESRQSCRGMLLSTTAEIDSRPQLEIHADEVKCAHGATTGRLDPAMFFYLLSRGLDRDTAQSLLVFAFLADVLAGMSLPAVRAAIEPALIGQLPDAQRLEAFR